MERWKLYAALSRHRGQVRTPPDANSPRAPFGGGLLPWLGARWAASAGIAKCLGGVHMKNAFGLLGSGSWALLVSLDDLGGSGRTNTKRAAVPWVGLRPLLLGRTGYGAMGARDGAAGWAWFCGRGASRQTGASNKRGSPHLLARQLANKLSLYVATGFLGAYTAVISAPVSVNAPPVATHTGRNPPAMAANAASIVDATCKPCSTHSSASNLIASF